MNKQSILQLWPNADLEALKACPVCGSEKGTLLHEEVRDWSFFSAPGAWTFWRCHNCASVYLNPRPTRQSIGRAYKSYYTHTGASGGLGWRQLRTRWRNERLSVRFDRNIEPRFYIPKVFQKFVAKKAARMGVPFGWKELTEFEPGKLMDVGCGSGSTLAFARQLGWLTQGLELDQVAVTAARASGLNVKLGGYEFLSEFKAAFDMVVCSHVIEHVFDPVEMIKLLHASLRIGGSLLLSTPNADSDLHAYFGKHWRGLEAPRHLLLLTEPTLTALLSSAGFSVQSTSSNALETTRESVRIARNGYRVTSADRRTARRVDRELVRTPSGHDFINIIAVKT